MPTKPKADKPAASTTNGAASSTGDAEIDAMFANIDSGAVKSPPEGYEAVPEGQTAFPGVDMGSAPPPSDSGVPDGELTGAANDELAKLAAKNGAKTGKGKAAATSAPSATAETAPALADGADASVPVEIPGLTSPGTSTRAGRKGKKGKKARAKPDPEKVKAARDAKKEKDKEKKAKAAEKEKERKAKLAAQKKERASERASKATPAILKNEPAAIQKLFADQYAQASRVDAKGNPVFNEKGEVIGGRVPLRRPKCDRGDFAAGWYTLMTFYRAERAKQTAGKAG